MSVTVETVTESALEGKNVVLTTPPGIGSVSKTLAQLEAAGLSIALLEAPVMSPEYLAVLVLAGDELRTALSNEIVNAEVLVFDGVDSALPETLDAVTEVMTHRTLRGVELPSVKSVVAIFVGDAEDLPTKFAESPNTVAVNVR
jgi:hypothetical protein